MQLHLQAALQDVLAEAREEVAPAEATRGTHRRLTDALEAWQRRHGYKCRLGWPRMDEALRSFRAPAIDGLLERQKDFRSQGATPFEQVRNHYEWAETYTVRVIDAMKQALREAGQRP